MQRDVLVLYSGEELDKLCQHQAITGDLTIPVLVPTCGSLQLGLDSVSRSVPNDRAVAQLNLDDMDHRSQIANHGQSIVKAISWIIARSKRRARYGRSWAPLLEEQ